MTSVIVISISINLLNQPKSFLFALSFERAYDAAMQKIDLRNLEKTHKALANRRRLAILQYLRTRKEANLGEIAAHIRLSYKATSKHLSLLVAADIVEKEQRSVQMFFKISKNTPNPARYTLELL